MIAVRVGDRVRVDQPGLLVPAPEPFRSGVVVASAWADQYRPAPGARSFLCATCGIDQDHLARFPGDRCIDCHDVATRDVVVTAADLVRAFGGR